MARANLSQLSRADAIKAGIAVSGGITGALIAGCASPGNGSSAVVPPPQTNDTVSTMAIVPGGNGFSQGAATQIEQIIQAQGQIQNGILSIEIDRNDITNVTLRGVPILPSFQINGTLYFQCISGDDVIMNADMALKPNETQPFINALISHGIIFQAFHQHFYDFDPVVWFIHFRARGNDLSIARAVKAALDTTSTPFPQTLPSHPTTPLPAKQIGEILGADPNISSNGVVNYDVPRKNTIILNSVRISPYFECGDKHRVRTAQRQRQQRGRSARLRNDCLGGKPRNGLYEGAHLG